MFAKEPLMRKLPLRLARVLGLAPYVQSGSILTQPCWLRCYSACVTVIPSLSAICYILILQSHLQNRRLPSMSDMFLTFTSVILALCVGLSRWYIVRRQYPQLQHILMSTTIRTGAPSTPSSLLSFYLSLARCATVILAIPLAYAAEYIKSAWVGALYCLATVECVLQSGELSLFTFLLDAVEHDFKRINAELAVLKLKQRQESPNLSEEVSQIREALFKSKDCLEGMCKSFGPQVALVLLNLCIQVVTTLAVSLDIYLWSLSASLKANTRLYVYFTIILATVPDFLFSILRALNSADGVTAEGSRSLTLIHSLRNSSHLNLQETLQIHIFCSHLSQRPATVCLCRMVTLDRSLILVGLGSVVNFFILILQTQGIKLVSRPVSASATD